MTLVLSLELVKTYRVLFPLVDPLRSFRVSRGGGHLCAPPPGRAKVAQTPGRARVKDGDNRKMPVDAEKNKLQNCYLGFLKFWKF